MSLENHLTTFRNAHVSKTINKALSNGLPEISSALLKPCFLFPSSIILSSDATCLFLQKEGKRIDGYGI